MIQNPLLSVVVTSYTTERLGDIGELLESIKKQTYPNIETIFVAERSIELYNRVHDSCKSIGLSNFNIIFSEDRLLLSGARSLGAKNAKGAIIAFVDDDVILFPEWGDEMIKSYQNDSIIGVSGAALPLWKDKHLDWLPKNYYWLVSCTDWTKWDEPVEARSLWGMNMSVRREAFDKTGSFLSGLGYHQPIAEDLEFSLRVKKKTGKKLLFNPKVKVWHKVYAFRINLRFVASRAHHIGVSRRILRAIRSKEQTSFHLERTVINGIFNILFSLPGDCFKSPHIAWKKFTMTGTIVSFATIGFLFPGKGIRIANEIRSTLVESEIKKGEN
jgi:glucosyl-dolichyl phosphate glucuronosyltransferase